MKKSTVRVYDTISKEYVDIEVSEEVYTYWVYFSQNVVQRIDISRRLRKDQHRAIFVIFINQLAELLDTEFQPFLQRFLVAGNVLLEQNKIIAP